jgi:nucleoid-associated protein YgaU
LKPYEPEPAPSYDYEYDYDDRAPRPRVLWGRVAALGIALILAFLLGRATGSGGDDSATVQRLRDQLQAAQDENASLAEQLQAAQQPQVTPSVEPTIQESAAPTVQGEEYVVQKGDTLRLIAQKKCGDPEAADLLAEVNDIADPTLISVGQTLIIPADCGA